MSFDPVNLVEKGYRAHPDAESWLEALARDVIPAIGADWVGGAAYLADVPKPPRHLVAVCREGSPVDADMNLEFVRAAHRRAGRVRPAPGVASILESGRGLPREITAASPVPVHDSAALFTHSGDGRVAVFSNVTASRLRINSSTKRLWRCIAIHLGHACRLVGRACSTDAPDVEAVIEPSGRVAHASGAAEHGQARELLQNAVKDMDRARTRTGRQDPLAALELWRGLLASRWSLVDHFDSDGRRYILARENAQDSTVRQALSHRQRQVVFCASVGWSNKEIGYELGLAENTVSAHLARSLDKMGIESRAELVRISTDITVAAMHQLDG
jgi:DNA-binding CsgD family transcriptional regulator